MPGGSDGSYLQTFTMPVGDARESKSVANVIGIIPGTKNEWKDQSVLVTAHYDHLGLGWPDVHAGDAGKVHPGADDNASGVAVMLELAHTLAAGEKPARTIVFVAFTGEEAGLVGSKYYTEHAGRFPLAGIEGVINLDTVGRLGDQKVTVIGTGTATEWQHIFRGASFVTGVESRNIPESVQGSDQVSFIQKGVPAVHIFTSAHLDYHRPSDTADKIDGPGLVKVATFTQEGCDVSGRASRTAHKDDRSGRSVASVGRGGCDWRTCGWWRCGSGATCEPRHDAGLRVRRSRRESRRRDARIAGREMLASRSVT